MKKEVIKLYISIIVCLLILILSIPLWNYSYSNTSDLIAKYDIEYDIALNISDFGSLSIIEDDRAMELIDNTTIDMKNRNNFAKDSELVMVISKESTVKNSYIHMSINDEIIKIGNLYNYEDESSYYYVIDTYSFDAYESKSVNVRIWLDKTYKSNSNSKLIINFKTR